MWTLLNNKIKIFENINKTNKILLILLIIYYIVEIIVTSTHQTAHVLLLHCVQFTDCMIQAKVDKSLIFFKPFIKSWHGTCHQESSLKMNG